MDKKEKITYYGSIQQALATINDILTNANLGNKARMEFEDSKRNLENICKYL